MEPMSAASGGMQTIYCSYCSVQLSFPRGSMYIQCPRCQATQNPHLPQQTVCIGCGTLLAHPANSLYIQCPKCMITQNARENRANVSQNGGGLLHDSGAAPPKNPKKKKDPNAPKAASNAYMIFCKERRAELKSENPSLAFGKIGAKLGEIWRTLSSEEKRPYEERASSDRERYRKQMESYKSDGTDVARTNDGEESITALSKKRSTESFGDAALDQLENNTESQGNKRLKSESTTSDILPHYHGVSLYGHGFDNPAEHSESNLHESQLSGFSNRSSPALALGVQSHIHDEPGNHTFDISGIPDSDALNSHSNGLKLNVHRGLKDSDQGLTGSPNA
uniref:HMG box domain-containing protein n=1 Tax=Spongospora subterranea TaxID=70186 RepID=A0A0H5R411_9EUKA|eukprot:CRZ08873.1 hypothetical protein [Spongospora subterranea]